MTEQTQASDKQIAQLQKHKLHAQPWTLTGKEAWALLNEFYEKDDKPEVVKPGNEPLQANKVINEAFKMGQKAPSKEFHLSPEQVNTNALDLAIKAKEFYPKATESFQLIERAKEFKEFIEHGN